MNKTQAIIGAVGIILILLIASFYSGMINLQLANNYGTGLNLSTQGVYMPKIKAEEFSKGQTWMNKPGTIVAGLPINAEPLYKDKYIVSWMPNEMSELITLRGDFDFNSLPIALGYAGVWGHSHTVLLSCYYVIVKYIDITSKETVIIDTKNGVGAEGKLWDTNYVEMVKARFPPDSRHVASQGYQFPNGEYDKITTANWFAGLLSIVSRDAGVDSMMFLNPDYGRLHGGTWWYPHNCQSTIQTDTMEFYMKGLRTGALKVSYGVTYAYLQQDGVVGWHGTFHYGVADNVAFDYCYLASGAGDINILSTNHIPESPLEEQAQKEMENATGKTSWGGWYTKYVFEEGKEVKIGVKTGYSGSSLSQGDEGYGDPWTLEVYNSAGMSVKQISVADNFNGQVSYTIPAGAFIPGGNNEWKVILKNTLFDEAETVLFVVDSLSKVPGITVPSLDKDQYVEGDDVTLTLVAVANPSGTSQISTFWVDVKYGSTSSLYHVSGFPRPLPAVKKAGTTLTYTVVYTFPLENLRPVSLDKLYVRAHAIDSAGRAGVEGEIVGVYVEQKVPVNPIVPWELQEGDLMIILIVIAIIVILVAVYLFTLYRKGKFGKTKRRRR